MRRSAYSHIIRERPGIWRFRQDLNLRPAAYEAAALPTELQNHAPVGCVNPPGNRKGTEGENWRLTQEAGGFYPANFIQAHFIKRTQWVSAIFVIFYIKFPRPLFPPPPQRERSFLKLHCKFLEGERGCVYIALYPARETPPVFPLPLGTPPLPLPGSRASPAAEITAPAPELLNRPAPAGGGNAQNLHSSHRSPAATTEIFNSPLNLAGKG